LKLYRISEPTDRGLIKLKKLCGFGEILYKIPITPKPHCTPNNCFNNVARYVHEYGGEQIYGWYFITSIKDENDGTAISHSVWKKDGKLIDITPHNDPRSYNLFAEKLDLETEVEYYNYINTNVCLINKMENE
jgi:hypothetical protein